MNDFLEGLKKFNAEHGKATACIIAFVVGFVLAKIF